MAQQIHHTTTHQHTVVEKEPVFVNKDGEAKEPSKMHAAVDKLVGGIKETVGTVAHAESLKESGREQKREGDAEALAAGKGDKHYDPALARKGVGIQHKHMGPNPKKHTEGPCAGCKDGTCQIGHDYDAAICHSVTQGHADAGHVKNAGLGGDHNNLAPTTTKVVHHDDVKVVSDPTFVSANRSTLSNVPVSTTTVVHPVAQEPLIGHHQNIGAHHLPAGAVPVGHNTAYDAALHSTKNETGMHSERDHDLMAKASEKHREEAKKEHKKAEKAVKEHKKEKKDKKH